MTTPTTVMIRLEDLRTLLHQANPTYTAQQIERALAAYTGQPDAPKPAKKAIKPVAPARTALQHAQTLSLVSAALRPSLNRNAPSTRWVINFTFGQWADASSFTQA